MPLITIKEVDKSFGSKDLFVNLNLKIYRKEKIGLIGPNGCGKTTLFKMLLNAEQPDSGEFIQRKGTTIGYLPQESIFDGKKTVMEEMHSSLDSLLKLQKQVEEAAEKLGELQGAALETAMHEYDVLHQQFELLGGYNYESQIKMILGGVGLHEEHYNTLTSQLSGGQLSRLGLAQVLMSGCDLLLLDEPTNHLDLAAIEWLEKFLRSYPGAAVIVSHDRYLLDKVAVKIIELENHRASTWKGNYSDFLHNKEIDELQKAREFEKRKSMVDKELDFIERNRAGVKSKMARGREARLNRLLEDNPDFLAKSRKHQTLSFRFEKIQNQSYSVLKCKNLSKAYGELELFKNLEFELICGDRIIITGPNGTGKSTLLKLALGSETPTTGKIAFASTVNVGYMDQHGAEMDKENTVIEEIQRIRPDMLPSDIRNLLGGFLFYGDDPFKQIKNLSGGEQNRLMLCRLFITNPDVLVLDEPTNHLDIKSKEALEKALAEYNGTVIAVSHDRFFINKIGKKLLVMGVDELGKKDTGKYEFVEGQGSIYSVYSELIDQRNQQAQLAKEAKKSEANAKNGKKGKRQAPPEIKHLNKYRIEQIEEFIMEKEELVSELKANFGLEEYYKDHSKMAKLQSDLDNETKELDLLYMAYEYKM